MGAKLVVVKTFKSEQASKRANVMVVLLCNFFSLLCNLVRQLSLYLWILFPLLQVEIS